MAAQRRPRVVIVGAGMAGLSAAVKLSKTDMFDVMILEALDRPGGRIHTSWQLGHGVIEMGANWIHGEDGNPVYQLAKDNGLLQNQDPGYESSSSSSSCSSSSCSSRESSLNGNSRQTWMEPLNDSIFVRENGSVVPSAIVNQVSMWYNNLSSATADVGTHGSFTTAGEYLTRGLEGMIQREVADERDRELYRLVGKWCFRMESLDSGCQSLHDLSLVHFNDFDPLPGNFYSSLGKKGYQGILDVLLKQLPEDTIRYSSAVSRVVWEQDLVTDAERAVAVHFSDDAEIITADHVVFTASVGYLKENHLELFIPPLPSDKQLAIDTISFGTVNKIFLRFKEPFWYRLGHGAIEGIQLLWDKDNWHDDAPITMAMDAANEKSADLHHFITRGLMAFDTVDGHDDVLCAWISGQEAEYMEQLSDDELEKICVDTMAKFLKRDIPKPVQIAVSRWRSNPYIRGSYTSSLPVHSTGEEYDTMARPICQERRVRDGTMTQYPVLLFAGEGCNKSFQSTVHGAMVTGQQQAEHLIQFHQLGKPEGS